MGFSEDVEQQRSNEVKSLRQWVGWGLVGSFVLHGLSLSGTMPSLVKSRPTEVVVVPRREPEAKPTPPVQPKVEPKIEPEIKPEIQPEIQPSPTLRQTVTASRILPPGVMPEGEADAERDESPLVGSGLAEGDGGFSEGIGLNRSNSTIRGSGGGERRGIEGGVPGGIIAPPEPIVTAPTPPLVEERTETQPIDPRLAVCRRCPSPEYPRSALQAAAEGRVQMAVDLDSQGRVVGVRLANSSGNTELDRAVLETVRQRWRFEGVRGGASNVPVEVYMTVDESELNQRAQDWGDRTAIEIPDAGFATSSEAAPEAVPESVPESVPENTGASIRPQQPTPESSPASIPQSVPTPVSAPIPSTLPESEPEMIPEPIPAAVSEPDPAPIPESVPEPEPEPFVEPALEVLTPVEPIAPELQESGSDVLSGIESIPVEQ
jgi:TonB family protein